MGALLVSYNCTNYSLLSATGKTLLSKYVLLAKLEIKAKNTIVSAVHKAILKKIPLFAVTHSLVGRHIS